MNHTSGNLSKDMFWPHEVGFHEDTHTVNSTIFICTHLLLPYKFVSSLCSFFFLDCSKPEKLSLWIFLTISLSRCSLSVMSMVGHIRQHFRMSSCLLIHSLFYWLLFPFVIVASLTDLQSLLVCPANDLATAAVLNICLLSSTFIGEIQDFFPVLKFWPI